MMKKGEKRVAVIDKEACIKEKCYLCIKVCPVNRMGKECIVISEDDGYPIIDEHLCVGCGICVKKCPTDALTIINLSKDLGDPIFSYGKNSFRLYGIPLPKEGACVGFVGKNGIGKTTALRLISKQIKPNFGEEREFEWEEVYERLTIEQREYFKKVGNEIKTSVKPQMIESLRSFPGTVAELIEKMNVKLRKDIFDLTSIEKKKVSQLSGGELQKVAIAIAYSKDADIYYFDEPMTYLDIYERLNLALKIKSLAEEKTVIVVEHDLTLLDYVSDYVYVFFGENGAYGAVSSIKPVRNGINEYISGYLKAENLRFRDYEIKFGGIRGEERKATTWFTYPTMEKSFNGEFKTHIEGGDIRKGEVIGIVGRNALGKTLFVKMLAGVIKPDNTEININAKASYKPQYLEAEDIYVKELFSREGLDVSVLNEAKRRLEIKPSMMEKKLNQLSGGELQKVAVSYALSLEADIYLFDEPTAFLDVEQRLALADLIVDVIENKERTAFIVDHDITFIDAISSRIILFEGKPSVEGYAHPPMEKEDGMNAFLKSVGITLRKDVDSNRHRINKPGSVLDRKQREEGRYYV